MKNEWYGIGSPPLNEEPVLVKSADHLCRPAIFIQSRLDENRLDGKWFCVTTQQEIDTQDIQAWKYVK